MSSLRRLATTMWRPLGSFPPIVDRMELALLGGFVTDLSAYNRCEFTNLARLVVNYYCINHSTCEILLKMPRLTYLVVQSLEPEYVFHSRLRSFDSLTALIRRVPRSCRVIFSMSMEAFRAFDYSGFRSTIRSRSDCRDVRVDILTYWTSDRHNKWLEEHIGDGTFWEIDLENYRDPEHQIEGHCE